MALGALVGSADCFNVGNELGFPYRNVSSSLISVGWKVAEIEVGDVWIDGFKVGLAVGKAVEFKLIGIMSPKDTNKSSNFP